MTEKVPLESEECADLVSWIEDQNKVFQYNKKDKILFSKLTQDFFINLTGLRKIKYLQKQRKEGKRKGVPDFIIIIPNSICRLNKSVLIFIELKRRRKTLKSGAISEEKVSTSPEQEMWVENLSLVADVQAFVSEGADKAIETIKHYL